MDEDTFDSDPNEDFGYSDSLEIIKQGAEAKLYRGKYLAFKKDTGVDSDGEGKAVIVKERFTKNYRHPALDGQLRKERLKGEVRCLNRCRQIGIDVPALYFIEPEKSLIIMEYIEDSITVRDHIASTYSLSNNDPQLMAAKLEPLAAEIGRTIAIMHKNNTIHGDLTTSNMLLRTDEKGGGSGGPRIVMIDFGLSYDRNMAEDKGVDLYVLEKALLSTHPQSEALFETILQSYWKTFGKGHETVRKKLEEVRLRGRKRLMVG